MQEKNAENCRFFQRAKTLQKKRGFITDEQLAALIGISPKSYYNAIKDSRITEKTWAKLDAAEAAAGITPPTPTPPAVFQTLEKRGSDFPNLGKKDADFSKPWKNAPDFFQTLEKRLSRIEAALERIEGKMKDET